MAVFVLPKWAKFSQLTKRWKLYQEFPARTQLFTRQSPENPAQQEVVAPAPWHVPLWLIDVDCAFYSPTSSTKPDQPMSAPVPHVDAEESIATLQQFSPPSTALLTGLTEARPLIRTELTVKILMADTRFLVYWIALRLLTSCLKTSYDAMLYRLESL
jgi:hypothetical protein